ncbi:MAG: hypothetical protein ACLT76_11885 [Clostridium fessum]
MSVAAEARSDFAYAAKKPLVGVHPYRGALYRANFIENPDLEPLRSCALIVSGVTPHIW